MEEFGPEAPEKQGLDQWLWSSVRTEVEREEQAWAQEYRLLS